jgi:hypothetical protein
MSDTNLNERMMQAIHTFETIRQASHIEWLHHQVLSCQGLDPSLKALDKRGDELKIYTKLTF